MNVTDSLGLKDDWWPSVPVNPIKIFDDADAIVTFSDGHVDMEAFNYPTNGGLGMLLNDANILFKLVDMMLIADPKQCPQLKTYQNQEQQRLQKAIQGGDSFIPSPPYPRYRNAIMQFNGKLMIPCPIDPEPKLPGPPKPAPPKAN